MRASNPWQTEMPPGHPRNAFCPAASDAQVQSVHEIRAVNSLRPRKAVQSGSCLIPFLTPSRAHDFFQTSQGLGRPAQDRIEAADVVQDGGILTVQVECSRCPGQGCLSPPEPGQAPRSQIQGAHITGIHRQLLFGNLHRACIGARGGLATT
jgi:hypothetical protein